MSYTHFTLEERKYLQKLLSEGYSQRKIAAILERSPSTISREIQRNRAKWKPHQKPDNPYWYNHWLAQNLYIRRRREQQRMALRPGTEAEPFAKRRAIGFAAWKARMKGITDMTAMVFSATR